jgi:hypothetical protein
MAAGGRDRDHPLRRPRRGADAGAHPRGAHALSRARRGGRRALRHRCRGSGVGRPLLEATSC